MGTCGGAAGRGGLVTTAADDILQLRLVNVIVQLPLRSPHGPHGPISLGHCHGPQLAEQGVEQRRGEGASTSCASTSCASSTTYPSTYPFTYPSSRTSSPTSSTCCCGRSEVGGHAPA